MRNNKTKLFRIYIFFIFTNKQTLHYIDMQVLKSPNIFTIHRRGDEE